MFLVILGQGNAPIEAQSKYTPKKGHRFGDGQKYKKKTKNHTFILFIISFKKTST